MKSGRPLWLSLPGSGRARAPNRRRQTGELFNIVVIGKNGALTEYGESATSACPALFDFLGGCGTVFKLTPPSAPGSAWTETVLHDFTDVNGDGASPVAPLVQRSTGALYGTTSAGDTAAKGTVFAVAP